jgi:hypothetical protein
MRRRKRATAASADRLPHSRPRGTRGGHFCAPPARVVRARRSRIRRVSGPDTPVGIPLLFLQSQELVVVVPPRRPCARKGPPARARIALARMPARPGRAGVRRPTTPTPPNSAERTTPRTVQAHSPRSRYRRPAAPDPTHARKHRTFTYTSPDDPGDGVLDAPGEPVDQRRGALDRRDRRRGS